MGKEAEFVRRHFAEKSDYFAVCLVFTCEVLGLQARARRSLKSWTFACRFPKYPHNSSNSRFAAKNTQVMHIYELKKHVSLMLKDCECH